MNRRLLENAAADDVEEFIRYSSCHLCAKKAVHFRALRIGGHSHVQLTDGVNKPVDVSQLHFRLAARLYSLGSAGILSTKQLGSCGGAFVDISAWIETVLNVPSHLVDVAALFAQPHGWSWSVPLCSFVDVRV